MVIDLAKTDVFKSDDIPDEAIEACLKVLRSVRSYALCLEHFDSEMSIITSHAHRVVYEYVKGFTGVTR